MDIKKEIEKNLHINITQIFTDKPYVLANLNLTINSKPFGSIILNNLTLVRSPNFNKRLDASVFLTTPYDKPYKFSKVKIYRFIFENNSESNLVWETIEYLVYQRYLERREEIQSQNNTTEVDNNETLEDILSS